MECKSIFDLFCQDNDVEIEQNENLIEYKLSSKTFVNLHVPTSSQLLNYLSLISENDAFTIKIILGNNIQFALLSEKNINVVKNFLKELQALINMRESDDVFSFEYVIHKNSKEVAVCVYDSETFINYLNNLPVDKMLRLLNDKINKHEQLCLVFITTQEEFHSKTICGKSLANYNNINATTIPNRVTLLQKRNDNCTCLNASQINLIPEDVYLVKGATSNDYNALFDKLAALVSLTFILNFSSIIEGGRLEYRLDGYKCIRNAINVDSKSFSQFDAEQYFNIYKWLYYGDSLADKIGLARNVLPLHLNINELHLTEDAYHSILSCHEIYLKENVEKYIQVKNQVIGLLNDLYLQANKFVDIFSGKLQKNILAVVTFIVTTMVMNVVTAGKISNIFTKDIVFIFGGITIFSILFFLLSLLELNEDIKRWEEIYNRQTEYYCDILDRQDINRIFENGNTMEKDKDYIMRKRKLYSILWVSFICICILIVLILGYETVHETISAIMHFFANTEHLKASFAYFTRCIWLTVWMLILP